MPSRPPKPGRPRLTLPLLGYALADVAGLMLTSLGGSWFLNGRPLFLKGFPGSAFEASVGVVLGLSLMFWAVTRLLKTMAAQHRARREE